MFKQIWKSPTFGSIPSEGSGCPAIGSFKDWLEIHLTISSALCSVSNTRSIKCSYVTGFLCSQTNRLSTRYSSIFRICSPLLIALCRHFRTQFSPSTICAGHLDKNIPGRAYQLSGYLVFPSRTCGKRTKKRVWEQIEKGLLNSPWCAINGPTGGLPTPWIGEEKHKGTNGYMSWNEHANLS